MINKVLGIKPDEALNGSTVLHAWALQNGANVLRVHDVLGGKASGNACFKHYHNALIRDIWRKKKKMNSSE